MPLNNLDLNSGTTKLQAPYIELLKDSLNKHVLSDIFRERNPETALMTWVPKGKRGHSSARRLDYFFISDHLSPDINEAVIQHGFGSDHRSLIVTLKLSNKKYQNRNWRLNEKCLEDKEFITVNLLTEGF
jgi:exonuclease III